LPWNRVISVYWLSNITTLSHVRSLCSIEWCDDCEWRSGQIVWLIPSLTWKDFDYRHQIPQSEQPLSNSETHVWPYQSVRVEN